MAIKHGKYVEQKQVKYPMSHDFSRDYSLTT